MEVASAEGSDGKGFVSIDANGERDVQMLRAVELREIGAQEFDSFAY